MTSEDEFQWIIGNIKHAGFYRVNYEESNWKSLIQQLNDKFDVIDPVNRAVLIDDSFNLGKAERIDQILFLDLISYLKKEIDNLPFVPAFTGLNSISNLIADSFEVFNLYQKFYVNLLEDTYKRIGWKSLTDPNDM